MTKNQMIALIVSVVVAAGFTAYAYMHHMPINPFAESIADGVPKPDADGPKIKAVLPTKDAAKTKETGTYYTQVSSVQKSDSGSTVATFFKVKFYEGEEARTEAAKDNHCPMNAPLDSCVPSLSQGYYVRPDGIEALVVNVTASTDITLGNSTSTPAEFMAAVSNRGVVRPVFKIQLDGGVLESVTQVK